MRPLPTALAFAILGPALGILLTLAYFSPALVNLGPLSSTAIGDLAFAVYIVGAPPLAAAGLLIGVLARRGARLPTLTLVSIPLGLVFGALSAALLMTFAGSDTPPSWQLILTIAIGVAVAAFITTALVGLFLGLRGRRAGARR